jgi:catechol 2,3-dioxygenase-like lactoylglutathione lyase family enzyme
LATWIAGREDPLISHVSLGVRSLAASTRFFDACLAAFGHVRLYVTEKVSGYGPVGGDGALDLLPIGQEEPRSTITGFHLAFDAPSRAAVEAFHAAAVTAGGSDAGPPGLRHRYHARYYAAFVLELDGHKTEAVHQGGLVESCDRGLSSPGRSCKRW